MSSNPQCAGNSVHWLKSGQTLEIKSFYSGDPWSQTHLPKATADSISLLKQAHVQYQSGTGGSTVEKPAETLE